MLKLSLIIPVYNEERHIKVCLDAVAAQTDMPNEVVVVNNNCTDKTLEIAKKYRFVTIISETRQGRSNARTAGFNHAKGDLIARIDADSIIETNWVERVKQYFELDNELSGLTGLGATPAFPIIRSPKTTLYTRAYYWNVHGYYGTITTWGATMVIRKTAWELVKNEVCLDDKLVHEDIDVALCMVGKSLKIIQANDVRILSYNQSFRYLPKLLYYIKLRNMTKARHAKLGNLPATSSLSLSSKTRIGSYLLSLPVLLYGLVVGLIFLPLDFFMFRVKKDKNWFN